MNSATTNGAAHTANLRETAEAEALSRLQPRPSDSAPRYWAFDGPLGCPARPCWIDCDPGHDDAMALILACHDPRLTVLGVSTIAGNQHVHLCTANALAVLHAAGVRGVPVFEGQARPLLPTNEKPSCPEIHGSTGLDGPRGGRIFPDSPLPTSEGNAVIRMAEALMASHAALSPEQRAAGFRPALIATGSLTNVALALTLFPALADAVEVVLMGGAVAVGNTSPGAEFNIQNDPEAASIVFNCGAPVAIVPLEVTHKALVTPEVIRRVRASAAPSEFRERCAELLLFFAKTYKAVFFFEDPPLHDPLAVAYAIDPGLFTARRVRCDVEPSNSLCPGRTVFDLWAQTGRPPNVTLCLQADIPRFFDLLLDAVGKADEKSPLNVV